MRGSCRRSPLSLDGYGSGAVECWACAISLWMWARYRGAISSSRRPRQAAHVKDGHYGGVGRRLSSFTCRRGAVTVAGVLALLCAWRPRPPWQKKGLRVRRPVSNRAWSLKLGNKSASALGSCQFRQRAATHQRSKSSRRKSVPGGRSFWHPSYQAPAPARLSTGCGPRPSRLGEVARQKRKTPA